MSTSDETRRAEVAAALRALASFIEEHPDLPLPWNVPAAPHLDGTDEDDRAEVDRIAAILGVAPHQNGPSHYEVHRDFGARVSYGAVAITEAHMVAWRESQEAVAKRMREAGKD